MAATGLERIGQMIHPAVLAENASRSGGFLDLLPPPSDQPQRAAQRAMNNRLVAAVYEGPWRQGGALVATGLTKSAERRRAAVALQLQGSDRLLDVACGPGNFTRYLGTQLESDGLAVGLDFSVPMLRRAVAAEAAGHVGYVRADARILPFANGAFDAVCCFAALYLVPEPFTVLDEMIRVLAPGGRIALMTSCARGPTASRWISTKLAGLQGMHTFDRADITSVLRRAGFRDINQQIRGLSQFVSATKG